MNQLNQSIADIPMPDRIKRLAISETGFPVPWFVAEIDGVPDFRVVDTPKVARAVNYQLCWICGGRLGRFKCFSLGPMCVVNRTSAEPPSHRDCAEYAVRACPFLSRPKMRRNEADMPDHRPPPGMMIARNPGVTVLWITFHYEPMQTKQGILFNVGTPVELHYFREGRAATRDEILESIESGLPTLRNVAVREGAVADFDEAYRKALELVPQ